MKKIVFGITVLMVLAVFAACAQQADPESDFRTEVVEGGGSVRIVEYLGSNTDVRIPSRIGGLPVTHIGLAAFRRGEFVDGVFIAEHQLTSVVIPDSVTVIGTSAFWGNQLTSVTIPNSVTSIGQSAFARNNLTNITIPNSVTVIEGAAFFDNQLSSVTIGNSVTSIGDLVFSNNPLTSVTISANITDIRGHVFSILGEGGAIVSAELTNLVRNSGNRAGTYTYNNGRWSVTFPGLAVPASGNRFANTAWERIDTVNRPPSAMVAMDSVELFTDGTGRVTGIGRQGVRGTESFTWSAADGRIRIEGAFGIMMIFDYELSGSTLNLFYHNRATNAYSTFVRVR